jgi:hypothetical protein
MLISHEDGTRIQTWGGCSFSGGQSRRASLKSIRMQTQQAGTSVRRETETKGACSAANAVLLGLPTFGPLFIHGILSAKHVSTLNSDLRKLLMDYLRAKLPQF